MAQVIIRGIWSDDYPNEDGIYVINYPNGVDYKESIISAQDLLEKAKDSKSKETFLEYYGSQLCHWNCTEDDYEELRDWYDSHANCSLISVLNFICAKCSGWSYINPNYDIYDLDYEEFKD